MARVILTVQLEGGASVQAVVCGKTTHPDALSIIKREAVDAFKQALDHFVGEGVEDVCAALEAGLED